ncbi:prepilin-type N-terminal cleavage/methylation domain-containing protein [Candidatus Gracilibacteria bacterium]|nr:prepilin-type N-terminal cleavage/methylation domain-containing protein [Candidatus Gracilibacteria bacterium]
MLIHKKLSGFTLTELVIVMTILAILSTIAFVSYTNSISDTRDNKRQLDIDTIKIALNDYKNKNGYYPLPGDAFNITYSGAVVAKQGVLNTKVILSSLETIPTDPLDNHYYSYAVTADGKQYQLAATLENDGEETTLLGGDYQSVTKTILPNILLASDAGPGDSVEIGAGIGNGSINRKLFLFNELSNNIIHSLEGGGTAVTGGEELVDLVTQAEDIDYWQKHDYTSCNEISDAGRSIGPGRYEIMDDNGQLNPIDCLMITTCTASQHLEGGICVYN